MGDGNFGYGKIEVSLTADAAGSILDRYRLGVPEHQIEQISVMARIFGANPGSCEDERVRNAMKEAMEAHYRTEIANEVGIDVWGEQFASELELAASRASSMTDEMEEEVHDLSVTLLNLSAALVAREGEQPRVLEYRVR